MLYRRFATLIMLVIGVQNAIAQCAHTGEFATVCLRSYNEIDIWNPCSFHEWANVQKHMENRLGDEFISPFSDGATTSPGQPVDWFVDMCSSNGEKRGVLKPDWELFNRSLLASDWLGADLGDALAKGSVYSILPQQSNVTPAPYFAMYKKSSGLLRVFYWINGALAMNEGEDLRLESNYFNNSIAAANSIRLGGGNAQLHGYTMSDLENGYSFATALSQVSLYKDNARTYVFPRSKSSNFWLVVDKYLSYDPWTVDANGHKKEVFLDHFLKTIVKSEIQLNGTIKEEFSSDVKGGLGVFKDNPLAATALAGAVDYGQGYLDKHSSSFAKKIVGYALDNATGSSTKGGADETNEVLDGWTKTLRDWYELSLEEQNKSRVPASTPAQTNSGLVGDVITKGLDMAMSNGSSWIAGAIVDGLLGTTMRYKQEIVSLNGTIKTTDPIGSTRIPISSSFENEKRWPYYYRKNSDGTPAHQNNLGVFNFKAPPKMYVVATR